MSSLSSPLVSLQHSEKEIIKECTSDEDVLLGRRPLGPGPGRGKTRLLMHQRATSLESTYDGRSEGEAVEGAVWSHRGFSWTCQHRSVQRRPTESGRGPFIRTAELAFIGFNFSGDPKGCTITFTVQNYMGFIYSLLAYLRWSRQAFLNRQRERF